jgi:hypothetical protein
MFVTTPEFEQLVPKGLGSPHCRYWRAVPLSSETPWFLLQHRTLEGESTAIQTVAVAWESTLRQLVETAEPDSVVCVLCLAPSRSGGHGWSVKRASELWLPSESEVHETGPLLFGTDGEPALYDSYHRAVATVDPRRRLLIRVAP